MPASAMDQANALLNCWFSAGNRAVIMRSYRRITTVDESFPTLAPYVLELEMLRSLAIPLAKRLMTASDPLADSIWTAGPRTWHELFCIHLGAGRLGDFNAADTKLIRNCNRALKALLRDAIRDNTDKPNREYLNRAVNGALLIASFGIEVTAKLAELLDGMSYADLPTKKDSDLADSCPCVTSMLHKCRDNQGGQDKSRTTEKADARRLNSHERSKCDTNPDEIPIEESLSELLIQFIDWLGDCDEAEFSADILLSLLIGLIGAHRGDVSASGTTTAERKAMWIEALRAAWGKDPALDDEISQAIKRWKDSPTKKGKREVYSEAWVRNLDAHIDKWRVTAVDEGGQEAGALDELLEELRRDFAAIATHPDKAQRAALNALKNAASTNLVQDSARTKFGVTTETLMGMVASDENGYFPGVDVLPGKLEQLQRLLNDFCDGVAELVPDIKKFKKIFTQPWAEINQLVNRSVFESLARHGAKASDGLAHRFSQFHATLNVPQSSDPTPGKKSSDAREPCQKALAALRSFIARNGTPECCQPALGAMS